LLIWPPVNARHAVPMSRTASLLTIQSKSSATKPWPSVLAQVANASPASANAAQLSLLNGRASAVIVRDEYDQPLYPRRRSTSRTTRRSSNGSFSVPITW